MPFDRPEPTNIRAGIAVFAALAAVAIFTLLGVWWKSSGFNTYILTCTTTQGVYGLSPASQVRVGGLVMGAVVQARAMHSGAELTHYEVEFTLDRRVPLYAAARILVTPTGIGGEAAVDIIHVGHPKALGKTGPAAQVGNPLPSQSKIAAMSLEEYETWFGTAPARKLRSLMAQVQDLKPSLQHVFEDLPARFRSATEPWKGLMSQARADTDQWHADWNTLTQHAEHAVVTLGTRPDAAADSVLPALRATRDDLQKIDLAGAWQRAGGIQHSMRGALDSIDALQAQAYAVRSALNDAEYGVGIAGADFAIAGIELAAVKGEVLAAPWKLFARPSAREIEATKRMNEARVFAHAATDFELALAGFKRVLARDQAVLKSAPGLAELLSSQLGASAAQFDAAVARYSQMMLAAQAPEAPLTPATPHVPANAAPAPREP